MQKIGDYWVPDVDLRWFRNRRKTLENFAEGRQGKQTGHVLEAMERIRATEGAEAMAAATAIDAGANVGAYARAMAAAFGHVHAFEPAPDTFACLARNIVDWGLADRITAHPNALSAAEEGVSMGTGGWFRRSISREVAGPGDIPAVPIDSLGLTDVLFLKLDVEGYELKVLAGATQTLERCRPFVMMELKARKLARGTADLGPQDFLLARGYRVVAEIGSPVLDRLYAPADRG